MKQKLSLGQAKEIAEKLKKQFKFGKPTCPAWFKNTCTPMEQDGGYSVAICIPSWTSITNDESNVFLEPFEGTHIKFRIVTPPSPQSYSRKNDSAKKEEGKENT